MQTLDVDGLELGDPNVAHYVLDDVIFKANVQIGKHVFEHVDGASDGSNCNLLAGSTGDDELARRE